MKTSVVLALIAPVCVGAFVVSTTGARRRRRGYSLRASRVPMQAARWLGILGRILAHAEEEAADLGCAIKEVSLANGKLSVLAQDAGVDELQQLNTRLSQFIDVTSDDSVEALPPFLLEVSSPGIARAPSELTSRRSRASR